MAALQPRKTEYNGTVFRSRSEARWAIFFDALGVQWVYELRHYDFGVKVVWDDDEFREYLRDALDEAYWDEDPDEIIHQAYRERYERRLYLPDFWLPTFAHWVEIKGKAPTWEEQTKARELARFSGKPVTILWNHIYPDPNKPDAIWGDCTEIYGGDINIIALLAIEYGVRNLDRAFAAARHAHFPDQSAG